MCVREAIDDVVDGPHTGRWDLAVCHPIEKAYLGFRVEHLIRADFGLPAGSVTDFSVAGIDVDCKWSLELGGWMVPVEGVDQLTLVTHGNDHSRQLSVGLVRMLDHRLCSGRNRDGKRSFRKGALSDVVWLVNGPLLPENLLLSLTSAERARIQNAGGGTKRLAELFRIVVGRPVSRRVVDSVGRQRDSSNRVRKTRPILAEEGIDVLSWRYQKDQIRALGGPEMRDDQWISLPADGRDVGADS